MVYGSEFWAGLHVFSGKDLGMARNSSQYVWKHGQTAQA